MPGSRDVVGGEGLTMGYTVTGIQTAGCVC